MDRTFDNIRKENKVLMMEYQQQNLSTPEGMENADKIKKRLTDNSRDLQAFAVALGTSTDEPRIFRKRMLHK